MFWAFSIWIQQIRPIFFPSVLPFSYLTRLASKLCLYAFAFTYKKDYIFKINYLTIFGYILFPVLWRKSQLHTHKIQKAIKVHKWIRTNQQSTNNAPCLTEMSFCQSVAAVLIVQEAWSKVFYSKCERQSMKRHPHIHLWNFLSFSRSTVFSCAFIVEQRCVFEKCEHYNSQSIVFVIQL